MKSTKAPLISVVMPVYNALPFLDESITSILNQTLTDFEFVIFDDASTDGSVERLREWSRRDQRIRLYESKERMGLSGSSNAVVAMAQGEIIARMDADDVAHPDRLRRQLIVLDSRPDVALVGTLCNGINAGGLEIRPRDRWRLVRRSLYVPFPHGSAMFRRQVFDLVGGYGESDVGAEDQKLFLRMAAHTRVLTLPDVLYSYRYHSANATISNGEQAISMSHSQNGNQLAAFYMLGAMRLWAGEPPGLLQPLLKKKPLHWNLRTMMVLVSAIWAQVSPATLRMFLRWSIRVRDLVASAKVKNGQPYEWNYSVPAADDATSSVPDSAGLRKPLS